MKICELRDNWDMVRKDTITKYPHICCALLNRDIEIDGDTVILRYAPNESVIGKIAAGFKDSILFLTCAYMLLKMLLSKPYPILKGIIAKLSLRICFYRV